MLSVVVVSALWEDGHIRLQRKDRRSHRFDEEAVLRKDLHGHTVRVRQLGKDRRWAVHDCRGLEAESGSHAGPHSSHQAVESDCDSCGGGCKP